MNEGKAALLRLMGQLEADIAELDRLQEKNRQAQSRIEAGANDELDWAALGYTIHNIYNLLENYFLRISKFFENDLDAANWHKSLVEHMKIEVKGVRPRLLSAELSARLDELRSFRNVFRNIYQGPLDAERLTLLQKRIEPILRDFRSAHDEFVAKIARMARELEQVNQEGDQAGGD